MNRAGLPAASRQGTGDAMAAARELATNVVRAIEQLHAHGPNVVAVIIPDHWEPWTKVETEEAQFDLHDFVKAFCVQRGIATQFLRESTLIDPQACRVMWWLSLALYAKEHEDAVGSERPERRNGLCGTGFQHRQACRERLERSSSDAATCTTRVVRGPARPIDFERGCMGDGGERGAGIGCALPSIWRCQMAMSRRSVRTVIRLAVLFAFQSY